MEQTTKSVETNRLKNTIIAGVIILVLLGFILAIVNFILNQNPYGEYIEIKNYDSKVKNLSKEYKFKIESSLYTNVLSNSSSEVKGSDVKDAYIRDKSEVQNEGEKNKQYQGSFIVDIESLKQSYKVQYAYSTEENDPFVSGYAILVSCVAPSEVKYTEFKCDNTTDSGTENSNPKDAIINVLPRKTLSYQIRADASGEDLIIKIELRIPESDLRGDEASRREAVQLYKKMATDWIRSQGYIPENYTIEYNYTDDGVMIQEDIDSHGNSDQEDAL